ncbi:MAG: hypothetical protein WAK95_22610 [Desulfobacterales bacterium]
MTHGDVIIFTLPWVSEVPPSPDYKHRLFAAGLSAPCPAAANMSILVDRTAAVDERPLIIYKGAG